MKTHRNVDSIAFPAHLHDCSGSLIIDDWALSPLSADQRNDVLEILEDRYGGRSTIFASQLDAKRYHEYLGDPTVADAVCDRLIHNAHRVVLSGPSRRKEESPIK